jgi:hypothetical protein
VILGLSKKGQRNWHTLRREINTFTARPDRWPASNVYWRSNSRFC